MTIRRTILGPGRLTIDPGETGAKPFSEQVTECKLIPKAKTGDPIKVLSGSQVAGQRTETITIKGKLLPDFGETDSIQEWLWTNRGKTMAFEFTPRNDKAKGFTGDIIVEAVDVGGKVGDGDEVDFEWTVMNVELTATAP